MADDDITQLSDDDLRGEAAKTPTGVQDLSDEELTHAYNFSQGQQRLPSYYGSPGTKLWTGPEADEYMSAAQPLGNVLRAFGQGAETAWEHGENLGYSDDVNDWLKKAGIYGDTAKSQGLIMRAYNEGIFRPLVTGAILPGLKLAGAAFRGASAAFSGAQAGVQQTGEEVGSPALGRELAGYMEAFPDMNIPGAHEAASIANSRTLALQEIQAARELNVIGPGGKAAFEGAPEMRIKPGEVPEDVQQQTAGRQGAADEIAKENEGEPGQNPLWDAYQKSQADLRKAWNDRLTGDDKDAAEPQTPEATLEPVQPSPIHQDVVSKLIAAGRSEPEANAAAAITQAYYETRAARFDGAKGTPEELYQATAPDIRGEESGGPGGMAGGKAIMQDSQKAVVLFRRADASTFMHEMGHHWLNDLMSDALDEAAPDGLKSDASTVRQWLGADETGPIDRAGQEKFARGFEQYLKEGVSPSRSLDNVFGQFREWLSQIYQKVSRLGAPINDEIRGVFNQMLSDNPQPRLITPDPNVPIRPPQASEIAGSKVASDLADIHEADAEHTAPEHAAKVADQMAQEREQTIRAHAPDVADGLFRRDQPGPDAKSLEPAAVPAGEGTGAGAAAGEGGAAAKSGTVGGSGDKASAEGKPATVGATPKPAEGAEQPRDAYSDIQPVPEFVDKAGNIRLDNLKSPEDVKQLMRELAEQNNDFLEARGGVVSDVDRRTMADSLGLSMDNFSPMKPEGVPSSVWAEAVQKLTFQAADAAAGVAKEFGESGSPESAAAYLAAKQKLLLIANHFSTLTAEAGRTLRVFDKDQFQFVNDLVDSLQKDTGKSVQQLQTEAKALWQMNTTAKRMKMAQNTADPTLWQKLRAGIISLYVNNLISGPITHMAYTTGNVVTALFKVPQIATAATIDTVRAGLGGSPIDRVYYGEVGAQLYGMMHGAKRGMAPGWNAFKTGIPFMKGQEDLAAATGKVGADMTPAPAIGDALKALKVPEAIADKVGSFLEAPGRGVSAIHTISYSMNYTAEIARAAYRQASNEGLTGSSFATRIAQLENDPPVEMINKAHDDALNNVFMHRPEYGSMQQKLASAVNSNILAKIAIPFMQVGMNIVQEGLVKSTPIGLLSGEVRGNLSGAAGEVARTEQIARMAVGSSLAMGMMALAATDVVTGSGPSDPKERALKESTGWKAESFHIGDSYIPYRKWLGSLGGLITAAADTYHVGEHLSEGDMAGAAKELTHGFGNVVADENWLGPLSQLFSAAENWDKPEGERYLRNIMTGFLPYSSMLSQTARTVDDSTRRVNSITEAFQNKIPVLSEGLYPQRDWAGRPIESRTQLPPFSFGHDRHDATAEAMEDAQVFPDRVKKDIRGVPLSEQQYDDYARLSGQILKQRLDAAVNTPGFTSQPLGYQNKFMKQTITHSREAAAGMVMAMPGNENILRQAIAAKSAQLRGELPSAVKQVRQTHQ